MDSGNGMRLAYCITVNHVFMIGTIRPFTPTYLGGRAWPPALHSDSRPKHLDRASAD